jgi:hypothetical protein
MQSAEAHKASVAAHSASVASTGACCRALNFYASSGPLRGGRSRLYRQTLAGGSIEA